MAIKDLPEEMRPREKLLRHGAAALADVELLALLLRTGRRGHDVFALAREVLAATGGFQGLLAARDDTLASISGLGPAKRCEIAAVAEIARRALAQRLREAPVLDHPQKVREYVALRLAGREREIFAALFLDTRLRLIDDEELFAGTLAQASVHPREIARALQLNAAAVIVAHNHPSGVAEPSRADEQLTQTIRSALQLLDVRLIDHLVVGQGSVVSFAERGLL